MQGTIAFLLLFLFLVVPFGWFVNPPSSGSAVRLFAPTSQVECGPSCLRVLVDHCGWPAKCGCVPEPICRHPSGWSLQDLADSAVSMGWSAEGTAGNWSEVRRSVGDTNHAVILHVDGNHFVLASSASGAGLVLFDPAVGELVEIEELPPRYRWDGVMLKLCRSN